MGSYQKLLFVGVVLLVAMLFMASASREFPRTSTLHITQANSRELREDFPWGGGYKRPPAISNHNN